MNSNINSFVERKEKICVVGLGYVGLPLAILFSSKFKVVGLEIDDSRLKELNDGYDRTNEADMDTIVKENLEYTAEAKKISNCKIIYVTVPTPIDEFHNPDPTPVTKATETIAKYITKGSYIVYESTVYPGLTEEVCIPIVEEISGLKWKKDFNVCFSPERVNPGDKKNTVKSIAKVVGGDTPDTTDFISQMYEQVIEAEIYRASSIKVAEASKVVENAQRDVNIAFMNEIALIMNKLDIDTNEVIKAMNTKWNALGFTPGLVGGHCIGVDPYYLIQKALEVDISPQVMIKSRDVNESIAPFIADETLKLLAKTESLNNDSKVLIMGVTFKPNVPDLRNTKVIKIAKKLQEYNIDIDFADPETTVDHARNELGIDLIKQIKEYDAVIFAVDHKKYKEKYNHVNAISKLVKVNGVIIDVKSMITEELQEELEDKGYTYWNL